MDAKETSQKDGRGGKTPGTLDKGTKRPPLPAEIGGRDGPEPTRYGDWEVKGICSDF